MPILDPRVLIPVALLAALGFIDHHDSNDASARVLLAKSLMANGPTNVVAIVCQCDVHGANPGNDVTLKVTMSKDGKERREVLQPLSMQGYVSVDDGRRLKIYLPDDHTVLDQESPSLSRWSMKDRLKLIGRNYKLELRKPGGDESSVEIAGHSVQIVAVVPKAPEMPSRTFYIDKATCFVMRIVTQWPGESPVTVYDTKFVQYPDKLEPGTFSLNLLSDVTTKRYDARKKLPKGARAIKEVGFNPIVPQHLPYGFVVQDAQENNSREWNSVVLRITDGIQMASVYEWRSDESSKASPDRERVGDVELLIKSELPDSVRDAILQSFVSAADSRGGETPELGSFDLKNGSRELGEESCSLVLYEDRLRWRRDTLLTPQPILLTLLEPCDGRDWNPPLADQRGKETSYEHEIQPSKEPFDLGICGRYINRSGERCHYTKRAFVAFSVRPN